MRLMAYPLDYNISMKVVFVIINPHPHLNGDLNKLLLNLADLPYSYVHYYLHIF